MHLESSELRRYRATDLCMGKKSTLHTLWIISCCSIALESNYSSCKCRWMTTSYTHRWALAFYNNTPFLKGQRSPIYGISGSHMTSCGSPCNFTIGWRKVKSNPIWGTFCNMCVCVRVWKSTFTKHCLYGKQAEFTLLHCGLRLEHPWGQSVSWAAVTITAVNRCVYSAR